VSRIVAVDDLTFELRRSDRRRTLGLTLDRDGALMLHAPVETPLAEVEAFAREKRFWIYTKLAEKELLLPPAQPKEFVSGQGFYYLGRSYRLLVVDPDSAVLPPLRFYQGRFMLRRDERERGHEHFVRWYTAHSRPCLERAVQLHADRAGVEPRGIEVRDLGYRWGSCSEDGRLNFHWRLVCLPPRIIEYVVVHELVHLCEPHHTDEFWRRIERILPDYAERKRWLAENGADYVL
jgi:predicted metal-dependent hydrolase